MTVDKITLVQVHVNSLPDNVVRNGRIRRNSLIMGDYRIRHNCRVTCNWPRFQVLGALTGYASQNVSHLCSGETDLSLS